ncbi:MAG: lysophospholipid acyltransferase family protein [Deltaproteobacteria bacterium]|nr:lysophospholipid acyltransferase family protein [Deltaproteobacteria bacterium]
MPKKPFKRKIKKKIKRTRKGIKNWIIYISLLLFFALIRKLNRTSAIRLMQFSGNIAYVLVAGERKKTIRHLSMALGDEKSLKEIKEIARKVFIHFGIAAVDMIRLPIYIKKDILDRLVFSEGFHHLENALSKGKGVIVLTGHFGNWEIGGAWLAQKGVPFKVVGTPLYDPRLDEILVNGRNRAGYKNIARSTGTREIIRSLKNNSVLALLVDLDTKVEGVFVNFFNKPAHTATGPVILSQKYSSPIVPVFIRLCDDLTYCVSFEKEIDLVNTGCEKDDLIANTQKLSDIYEKVIRQYPEQWIWMHERWKKQPSATLN